MSEFGAGVSGQGTLVLVQQSTDTSPPLQEPIQPQTVQGLGDEMRSPELICTFGATRL